MINVYQGGNQSPESPRGKLTKAQYSAGLLQSEQFPNQNRPKYSCSKAHSDPDDITKQKKNNI